MGYLAGNRKQSTSLSTILWKNRLMDKSPINWHMLLPLFPFKLGGICCFLSSLVWRYDSAATPQNVLKREETKDRENILGRKGITITGLRTNCRLPTRTDVYMHHKD
jgi:hypothetical protein